MKYAVLIELSRKNIAFRYYRDDAESAFLPFDENTDSMPLAIYCEGNEVQIGTYAQRMAEQHDPCAWTDIFEVVKQPGTFSYRGQQVNNNELLLVAVKKYLTDFFDRILVKSQGTLEANTSTLPLAFLFHPDIDKSERLFVEKSFRDNGFVNLAAIDLSRATVARLKHANQLPAGKKAAITVLSDGSDLWVTAIDTQQVKEVKSMRIAGKGIDPRVSYAVDLLWESMGPFSFDLSKENEMPTLQKIAQKFLTSDEAALSRPVMFSDGVERDCYLAKSQLDGINAGTDDKIRTGIWELTTKQGWLEADYVIVLCGNAASSSYFESNMRAVCADVIVDKDPGSQNTLHYLLDWIIGKHFNIGQQIGKEPQPLDGPTKSRVIRTIKASQHMMPDKALNALNELELELKRITPAPIDLLQYLDQIDEARVAIKKITQPPTPPEIDSSGNGPLPPEEIRHANEVIASSRKEPVEMAVKHLQELQAHIKQLNPKNLAFWKNRINHEIEQTQKRSLTPPPPGPRPLSPDEVKNANKVISTCRSMDPNAALKQLQDLLEHIKQLNPLNLGMWTNRLNNEIKSAQKRLDDMPKKRTPVTPPAPPRPVPSKPTQPRPVTPKPVTSRPAQPRSVTTKPKTANAVLSREEVEQINKVILSARSMDPNEALKQLRKLLLHIQQASPKNLSMWQNRLNNEIKNAEQRLAHKPKTPTR